MTGSSAPQNPGVQPWPPPCTQTEKTSLGKGAAQVIGSHGLKLSQRPGTFQPPDGRLTPALCPQLSLQRSFLAQGPLIPKGQRSERVLGVCYSSFRGPMSNGEPLGQQLCLSPGHKAREAWNSQFYAICFSTRGGVHVAYWGTSSSSSFPRYLLPHPPSPPKVGNTLCFANLHYAKAVWG